MRRLIGFMLVLLLAVILAAWGGGSLFNRGVKQKSAQEIQAEAKELEKNRRAIETMQQTTKNLAQNIEATTVAERTTEQIQAVEKLAAESTGPTAIMARVTSLYTKELAATTIPFETLSNSPEVQQVSDFTSITERRHLAERRALMVKLLQGSEAVERAFLRGKDRLRELLVAEKMDGPAAEILVASIAGKLASRSATHTRLRKAERDVFKILDEMLALLDQEWGRWKAKDVGRVAFESDAATKRFEIMFDALTKAAAEQDAAVNAWVELVKKRKP